MHKAGKGSAFTSKYRVTMLVYIEQFADIRLAIQLEKTLKHYTPFNLSPTTLAGFEC